MSFDNEGLSIQPPNGAGGTPPPTSPPNPPSTPNKVPGTAVAALVVGIIAFLLGLVPVLGLVLGATAIILGAVALRARRGGKGKSIVGIVLGTLAALTSILTLILLLVGSTSESEPSGTSPTASPSITPSATPSTTPSVSSKPSPSPSPSPEVETVEMPDLVGELVLDAKDVIFDLGLFVQVDETSDDAIVVSTDPAANTEVVAGTMVIIVAEVPAAELDDFVKLSDRDFAKLAKDPDSQIGENFLLYGVVTQFDAATGVCIFRANSSNSDQSGRYEFDVNAIFSSGDADSNCPVLDDIVLDDHVKIWATVQGSFSYETQIGGETTVPAFDVASIELLDSLS